MTLNNLFLATTKDNFRATKEAIAVYEQISRAKLNLEKSTIVPLIRDEFLDWFSRTGCRVAQSSEVLSLLGCPIGVKLTTSKEGEFVLDKVRKRVNHWANRLLSLQGCLVLLKHVLRAMSVHYFVALTLNKEGLANLDQICRGLFWGPGEQGQPKVLLVAWSTIL